MNMILIWYAKLNLLLSYSFKNEFTHSFIHSSEQINDKRYYISFLLWCSVGFLILGLLFFKLDLCNFKGA